MSGSLYLTGRWRPRLEGARACAERLAALLAALAPLHPAFARWNRQAETRAAANHPFCAMPPQIDELTGIFEKKMFTPGVPRMGYSVYAWNGKDCPYGVVLSTRCGNDLGDRYFENDVDISFPRSEAANADLLNIGVMKPALLALAAAWNPDWAHLQPWAYWERWNRAEPWDDDQRKTRSRDGYIPRIRSGWMVYLSADYARRIEPPRGIEAEPVADGGLLLIATRELFTPGNPAHDAAADAIQDSLLPLQNLPRS